MYALLLDSDEIEEVEPEKTSNEIVGIPRYIASGSHYFNESRYRFLIMPRYQTDLHSIMKAGRLSQKHFLIVASQIIDVLMHLHSKNYVHSDIKAENIMIGSCTKPDNSFNDDNKGNKAIQFGGANPMRSCRFKESTRSHSQQKGFNDTSQSHNLRPSRSITYATDENSRSTYAQESDHEASDSSEQDEDFQLSPRKRKVRRAMKKSKNKRNVGKPQAKAAASRQAKNIFMKPFDPPAVDYESDDRVYVIDFGLATKFIDTNGEHKPFCMDQRRAHDGTLEFTSRDAHFGAHSRRSDLECLGYNLIYWSQGFLPWKDDKLKEQPELVHRLKEVFMTDVREILKVLYGKDVPKYLGEFMHYVSHLEFDEEPNYDFLKELFDRELLKLNLSKAEMKLNLNDMREQCEPIDKSISENELMLATITCSKTVKKLGFLIATDNVDGTEPLTKPNELMSLNISCKASPKNLRSKEKTVKGKRPKRQPKVTEKELVTEKMAQGKKLSMAEIAILDPDQIARDRADREYEKFDEKVYYQTPQRYKGKPTYAILEIENKLKIKQSGAISVSNNSEIEPIKGYTKPMMDVLKKQQLMLEQQLTPVTSLLQVRSRDGLRNVIKPTSKNLTYKNGMIEGRAVKKPRQNRRKTVADPEVEDRHVDEEIKVPEVEVVPELPRRSRGRPKKQRQPIKPSVVQHECDESTNDVAEVEKPIKRKRGRPRLIRNVIEPPETEEDSVYYDIPGEGSNDGIKEISEDENEPEIIPQKRSRRNTPSDENSNQESVASSSGLAKKIHRSRYEADDDYDASTDEATNMSSASNATKSSVSVSSKLRRGRQTSVLDEGIATRKKTKSRSTSRSAAAFTEVSDQSECSEAFDNDSEYEMQSGDDSGEEDREQAIDFERSESEEDEEDVTSESELVDDSNDSNDSIDIKYSPIKTRHARRRINHFNEKGPRGKIAEQFRRSLFIERF